MPIGAPSRVLTAVEGAARRAGEFLRRAQDADGAWRDFRLKPGRAESWTTAYMGLRLMQAQDRWPDLAVERSLRSAARFLCASRQPGGWSYNRHCPPDSDTTAQAILYLRRAGEPTVLKDFAALAKFQLSNGHFATYKGFGSGHGWALGHVEVTAVAMQALGQILEPTHVVLQRAANALRHHVSGRHAAASYWWLSLNYLARELLMLESAYPGAPRLLCRGTDVAHDCTSFDRGLAFEVESRRGGEPQKLQAAVADLLSLQLADGSWPVQPILRVTNPRSSGFDDPLFMKSPVAFDDRRMFTTATVLGALSTTR